MAIWPWYGALAKGLVYDAGEFLQVQDYKHVQRWTNQIAARPAVKRGRMVNRAVGDPANQLHERHDASDFDLRTQDKLVAEAAVESSFPLSPSPRTPTHIATTPSRAQDSPTL